MAYSLQKFTFRSCGISLKSIKSYVDHQILHRHETAVFHAAFQTANKNSQSTLKANVHLPTTNLFHSRMTHKGHIHVMMIIVKSNAQI